MVAPPARTAWCTLGQHVNPSQARAQQGYGQAQCKMWDDWDDLLFCFPREKFGVELPLLHRSCQLDSLVFFVPCIACHHERSGNHVLTWLNTVLVRREEGSAAGSGKKTKEKLSPADASNKKNTLEVRAKKIIE